MLNLFGIYYYFLSWSSSELQGGEYVPNFVFLYFRRHNFASFNIYLRRFDVLGAWRRNKQLEQDGERLSFLGRCLSH